MFVARERSVINITILFVTFIILREAKCSLENIKFKDRDNFSIITETAIKICELCFINNTRGIAFIGDEKYLNHNSLWSSKFTSVILFNKNSFVITLKGDNQWLQKPQVYVITVYSPIEFNETLHHLKNSQWWQHTATYLILDKTSKNSTCGNNIPDILWMCWKMNLLSVTVLCLTDSIPILYTANPFTNRTHKSWNIINKNKNKQMTFYYQKYQTSLICNDLYYDKTMHLDGYELETLVAINGIDKSIKIYLDSNQSGWEMLQGLDGTAMRHIFHHMNVTLNILPYKLSEPYYRGDKVPTEVLWSINKGKYDIDLHAWYRTTLGTNTSTYPLWQKGPRILTQRKSPLTAWEKFVLFFQPWIIISLLTISLMSIIVLKIYWNENIILAGLDMLRLIINTSILKIPVTHSGRIYFTVVLIYFVIVNGLFQGKLAAILTKPVSRRQVNDLNDLKIYHHTVKGYKTYNRYLDSEVQDLFIGQDTFDCDMSVVDDENTACIREGMDLMQFAYRYDLHLSENIIVNQYYAFAVAKDWPLLKRVDCSLMAVVETGLIDFWYDNITQKLLENMNRHKLEASITKFDVIQLSSLMFAFNALSIGLVAASICFIIELKCQRVLYRISKWINMLFNRVKVLM
ncbi:hypothetical protein PV326_004369 [Microctonus aethiopoides]|nr:hypothetical protein PV326_004369 [Microctonus aethiopoides]